MGLLAAAATGFLSLGARAAEGTAELWDRLLSSTHAGAHQCFADGPRHRMHTVDMRLARMPSAAHGPAVGSCAPTCSQSCAAPVLRFGALPTG